MDDLVIDLMENPEGFKARVKSEEIDLNAKDENGKTILHYLAFSIANSSEEMRKDIFLAIEAVLDLGAAPHIMDNNRKAAGDYIDQTEENDPALKMIFEAQQKFNPRKDQGQYSPIGAEVKVQAQAAAVPLQNQSVGSNNSQAKGVHRLFNNAGRGGR